VKLVALLAAVLLAACDGIQAAPSQAPNELLFLAAAGQGPAVYEVSNGGLVANLPPGAFDATVTPGGDLGEAYVAGDDATLYRVRAGRPFRFDRLADIRGAPPYQAVLVPAPRLTTFVGGRTVLVVKGADGSLIGYQAGIQIWREGAAQGSELRRVDDAAVLGLDGNWSLLAPETGLLTPLASDCPDGPLAHALAVVGGDLEPADIRALDLALADVEADPAERLEVAVDEIDVARIQFDLRIRLEHRRRCHLGLHAGHRLLVPLPACAASAGPDGRRRAPICS